MRAFAVTEFGQPGSVMEVEDPQAAEGEILIRVARASVNAYDVSAASGATRAFAETRLPFVPGLDAAGTIEAVGAGVTGFDPGDAVIANAGTKSYWGGGTFAEFVSVPSSAVVHKPAELDFSSAATVPQTGLTGLGAVDALEPAAEQVIVVVGATGGVGSWFTQIAADRGARVVALARPDNFDYARELGASDVIDYTAGDVAAKLGQLFPDGIDAIADFGGDSDLVDRLSALLRPGGKVASSAARLDAEAFAARGLTAAQANKVAFDRMPELLDLIASGRVRTPSVTEVEFDEVGEALAAAKQKHTRGKVVVRVSRT
jgi:NADPH2:quinone reductase